MDDVPFKKVYLHGLVRDKDRQKMSKSKGNVIDPLGVAEIYGTDAVRMALVFGSASGTDIIISEDKIRAMRNFATKIWNASRFVLTNLQDTRYKIQDTILLTAKDKLELKKLDEVAKKVTKYFDNYKFSQAAEEIYSYFWHHFCDKVIEENKKRLYEPKSKEDKAAAQTLLLEILVTSLKLLHPFMPYITEEIYQKLPINNKEKSIMISSWPK